MGTSSRPSVTDVVNAEIEAECQHPIFEYMGVHFWGDNTEREQRHKCIDCGHEERDVPDGSVMLGHAPGECSTCDKFAAVLSEADRQRWIDLTAFRRGAS